MKYTKEQVIKLRAVLIDKISKSKVVKESCCIGNTMIDFVESLDPTELISWSLKHGLNLKNL